MELWQKLLTYRKKNDRNKPQKGQAEKYHSLSSSPGEGAPFRLQKDGIRVLLFRECDTRGRKLLYDSKTVVRVPIAESASLAVPSCKSIFKSTRHSSSFITPSTSATGLHPSTAGAHPAVKKCSSSNVRTSASSSSSKSEVFAEINAGYGYQYQQPESDTKQLGELVFGTVALAYKGSCSKLHLLQNPQRVLLSRSSPAPRSYTRPSCTSSDQGIEDSSFSSSLSSLSEVVVSRTESLDMACGYGVHSSYSGGPSWAVDMPQMLSTSHSEGDSGFGGPPSPYGSTCGSFLSPPSIPNTPSGTPSSRQGSGNSLKHSGSLNSLQRRFLRNVTTSLEALGREGEMNEDSVVSSGHHSHRVTRLGLAVILDLGAGYAEITKQLEDWLFLHLSVIEASLNKLQSSLDAAYLHPRTFASTTHQAVAQLQQDMLDLVSGPRLCRPVWLGLLGKSSSSDRQALCKHFVDTLASVLATFDTKQTNFFVSKLLTAVLTSHLGWVSTVAPAESLQQSPRSSSSSRSSSYSAPSPSSIVEDCSTYQATWVERLNESHPYSAVWAQLCELSGAVGYPPKTARTMLVGSNSQLLTQLLTILSYIIRCSQVVEHDIQSCSLEESTSLERQPCFSRTSSVASVVTIVEGGQREGQSHSQTHQNSSAKLHRDSSIRRSWRMNRENRGSRLYTQGECRINNGDSASGDLYVGIRGLNSSEEQVGSMIDKMHKGQGASLSPIHNSGKKEKETSSKWMLNDDVEIVIEGDKSLENRNNLSSSGMRKDIKPCLKVEKSLSTCRTSANLQLLIDDDSASSPGELSSIYSKTFYKSSSERLYPSLLDLDDHRETFGTVSLEPEVISEKVQKLFRPRSKSAMSQEPPNFDLTETASSVREDASQVPGQTSWKDKSSKNGRSAFNVPHNAKAQTFNSLLSSDISFAGAAQRDLVSDCAHSQNVNIHRTSVSSRNTHCSRKSPHKIIPAKDIKPEIEEGGKVLFLIGENERIEGFKKHASANTSQQAAGNIEPNWISLGPNNTPAIGFEKLENLVKLDRKSKLSNRSVTPPIESLHQQITSLPSPVDMRRVVRTRNVGRESAIDLTTFEKESTVYPLLSDIKSDAKGNLNNISKSKKEFTRTHRRRHSDPTNGDYALRMPSYCSPPLKGVVEESVVYKNVSETKEVCDNNNQSSVRNSECATVSILDSKSLDMENISPSSDCLGRRASEMMDSDAAKDTASTSNDEPTVLQMPRLGCPGTHQRIVSNNGALFPSNNLAGSLLGGVLDHYSSVFVLHATTQCNQWEDVLRQDLSAAAHHSALDQQVDEAVAVVADIDSWEVQLVSSHSIVVERSGSGSQIGLRVGMSPLVSAITDSILDLARLSVDPQFILQHLEERLCELYMKSQLLAEYLLGGAACGFGGSEASFSPYHLPELTRALGLDLNDLPLLLAVASTHTPALTRMFGISIKG